ncbi:hypothetical protein Bhyg_01797 [Pseudolycoriella hygida]|uniref:SAM domain-containing protein n=1 Tax=Pseudolycoriella hygida TaxID=35572 RepID=A0A9Q0S647_9DIPT|nr:hypothetical protein Bhyg_01797 [Pseudolycoriella hygida]
MLIRIEESTTSSIATTHTQAKIMDIWRQPDNLRMPNLSLASLILELKIKETASPSVITCKNYDRVIVDNEITTSDALKKHLYTKQLTVHVRSPLTPIPPILAKQSSFDFSPSAIKRCLEASRSTTPTVLKPKRTYTPNFFELSPPDFSPIEYNTPSLNRNFVTPNTTINSNSSLSKEDSPDYDSDLPTDLNASNINNRTMNMSVILEDIGLRQYKTLFEIEEIDLMAFLLFSENDFKELGIKDRYHHVILMETIKKLNNIN